MYIWGRNLLCDLDQVLTDLQAEAMKRGKGEYLRDRQNTPNDIFVTCPNYEAHGGPERTPSCSISKEEGLVHCFGCGYHGTLPGMVSDILGLPTPVDGYQWLRRKYTTPPKGHRPPLPLKFKEKSAPFIPEIALLQYDFDHPYTERRGLTDEVVDWFSIGYDQEQDAITIPMRDMNGNIVFIKKRPIKIKGSGKYLIEEGADKREIVFGLNLVKGRIRPEKTLFISEGEFDVMSWYCVQEYGIGLQGSELFDEQVAQIKKVYPARRRICLAFDNDKAGYKAFYNSVRKLYSRYRLAKLEYPTDKYFKDPNALLCAGRLKEVTIRDLSLAEISSIVNS